MEEIKKISAKRILEIFNGCMFDKTPEIGTKFIGVHGVHVNVGFNPERVNEYKNEIIVYLDQLSDEFKEESGGGMSFIKVPFTKDDEQWGEQIDGDRLMMLGMAIGRVKYLIEERLMWKMFPGGVPYYVITKEEYEPEMSVVE